MSNQIATLHNPHESYDSITPLDESESELKKTIQATPPTSLTPSSLPQQQQQIQSTDGFTRDNTDSVLKRTNSLDSLANSEQNSSIDEISDSDSLCELKRLSSLESRAQDPPRQSDLEEIINISDNDVTVNVPNEPVIKAFLEKSHQYGCDFEDCGYKNSTSEEDTIIQSNNSIQESEQVSIKNNNNNYLLAPSPVVKLNRKSSLVNSEAIRRMETILEEPIEAKISVKEILARFETMRETAEVTSIYEK